MYGKELIDKLLENDIEEIKQQIIDFGDTTCNQNLRDRISIAQEQVGDVFKDEDDYEELQETQNWQVCVGEHFVGDILNHMEDIPEEIAELLIQKMWMTDNLDREDTGLSSENVAAALRLTVLIIEAIAANSKKPNLPDKEDISFLNH